MADDDTGGTGGEVPPVPPAPKPKVEIRLSTPYIPVNANNTNGSPWRKIDGIEQVGWPEKRDFDVDPIPAGDQDLKSVTIVVTENYKPQNYMYVAVNSFAPG
jgi:hypothetical protein